MQVSEVIIAFDKEDPMIIGTKFVGMKDKTVENDITLTIDGIQINKTVSQMHISKIIVTRLIKSDQTQASVPIMTFLPIKEGDLRN
jgi:hypothetical protein